MTNLKKKRFYLFEVFKWQSLFDFIYFRFFFLILITENLIKEEKRLLIKLLSTEIEEFSTLMNEFGNKLILSLNFFKNNFTFIFYFVLGALGGGERLRVRND